MLASRRGPPPGGRPTRGTPWPLALDPLPPSLPPGLRGRRGPRRHAHLRGPGLPPPGRGRRGPGRRLRRRHARLPPQRAGHLRRGGGSPRPRRVRCPGGRLVLLRLDVGERRLLVTRGLLLVGGERLAVRHPDRDGHRDRRPVPGRRLQRPGRARRVRHRTFRPDHEHRHGHRRRGRPAEGDDERDRHGQRRRRHDRRRRVPLARRRAGPLLDVLGRHHGGDLPARRPGGGRRRHGHLHHGVARLLRRPVAPPALRGVPGQGVHHGRDEQRPHLPDRHARGAVRAGLRHLGLRRVHGELRRRQPRDGQRLLGRLRDAAAADHGLRGEGLRHHHRRPDRHHH